MVQRPDKPKILIIGDAVAPTGFARVIRSIFRELQADYELHQLATRYDGGEHDYPWKLYKASSGRSVYGYDQIPTLVEQIKPAIVFLLYDIPFQVPYVEALRSAASHTRIVLYSPVESGPIAPEMMQRLEGVSGYVLFTEYGRSEVEKALKHVAYQDPNFHFPTLDVIGHGIDAARFYPLSSRTSEDFAASVQRRFTARRALGFNDAEHLESFSVATPTVPY
jgi:hypothetical protein